jgi:hypothetical protein
MKEKTGLFFEILRRLPPKDLKFEVLRCRNCGRIRLMGEVYGGPTKYPCPKCNGTKFIAPNRFGFKDKVFILWAAFFRRKDLLSGAAEGRHDHYQDCDEDTMPYSISEER